MAQTVIGELGGVDILVNCAAKVNTGPMRDEDLDEHLNVKLKGYLRCARAFAPAMAERGWGRIVNVSGLAARQTGSVVGSVRNVAVAAMTKNLADEYGAEGVNVTVVHPAITRTERTPDTLAAMAAARGSTPAEVEATIATGNNHRPDGHRRGGRLGDHVPGQSPQRLHHRRCGGRSAAAPGERSTTSGRPRKYARIRAPPGGACAGSRPARHPASPERAAPASSGCPRRFT